MRKPDRTWSGRASHPRPFTENGVNRKLNFSWPRPGPSAPVSPVAFAPALCGWLRWTRGCVFSPGLQAIALGFQVGEEVGAAEHRAPRAEHRLYLFKHHPLF